MIARVIPAVRTPRRLGAFQYVVPEGLNLARGDLVKIPFRATEVVGLVKNVANEMAPPDVPLKSIRSRYVSLRFREETTLLLERLATRSFSSESSVLHAWLGTCPKRPSDEKAKPHESAVMLPTREDRFLANHLNGPRGLIAVARSLMSNGARILVLAPWTARAERIAAALNARPLLSSMPMGARYSAWSGFLRGRIPCLVATRLGAWLAAEADAILLDEPENDDHKQDDLSPRYDARWIAEMAHELGRPLIRFGATPPLAANAMTAIPALTPEILPIDLNAKDWSPASGIQNRTLLAIEDAVAAQRPVTIIHPIHGERARIRCADCGWEPACAACGATLRLTQGSSACTRCKKKTPMASLCSVCGSARLTDSRPGRERLAADLRVQFSASNIRTLSIGEWNATDAIPSSSLVVCTDLALLAGGTEDLRRKERLVLTLRRLADRAAASSSTLCIQAPHGLLTEAKTWLSPEGVRETYRKEIEERYAFRLPPAYRLAKVILRGNEPSVRLTFGHLLERATLHSDIAVQGLFPVDMHRPGLPRWIAHVTAPRETPDQILSDALLPATEAEALIDLDPVSFFE